MIWVAFAVAIIVVLFAINWGIGRHGESRNAESRWRATDERFVDPSTGRRMRGFLDDDGGRHYVPDEG